MTNRTALRLGLAAALATLATACGGPSAGPGVSTTSVRIGAAGGTVTTSSGFAMSIPAGALSHEVEIEVHEFRPEDGATHRIELEPRGTVLQTAAHVRMHHGADDSMRLVEMENEVEHAMENEHENEVEHAVEAEIHHLGVIEMRHARTCVVPCDSGLECDDGICKPHGG